MSIQKLSPVVMMKRPLAPLVKYSLAVILSAVLLPACNGLAGKRAPADAVGKQAANAASPAGATASDAGGNSGAAASQGTADPAAAGGQFIDTTKLKSEMNSLLNSVATGKPDTGILKQTASDVLNTTASVLSDSGISKMYGNSDDPSVRSAKEAMIKMRNGMGITPDKLDSMRKSAAQLH